MKNGWVYIIQCKDKSFYTGSTSNLQTRIYQHENNLVSCYTRNKQPLSLVFQQEFESIEDAIKAERQIKGWTRKKKIALIGGDFDLLHELSKCKNESKSNKM